MIHDVGDAPFDLVMPILKKMPAWQLDEIESQCPHIRKRSGELWKRLIGKDFADRPMPASEFRHNYRKYYKEKQAHLKNASLRLREGMQKLEQEKASRKITPLEVDPLAARARARYKASKAAPAGSRLIQRAIQEAKSKPVFSSKNVQFTSTGTGGISSIHPPRLPTKRPIDNTGWGDVKRAKTSSDNSSMPPGTTSRSPTKPQLSPSTSNIDASRESPRPPPPRPKKKASSSIFIQRR